MISNGKLILFQLCYFTWKTCLNTSYNNISIPTSENAWELGVCKYFLYLCEWLN